MSSYLAALPELVDTKFQGYLADTLLFCHERRRIYYEWILNIGIVVAMVAIFAALYTVTNHKQTNYEKQKQLLEDQNFVLTKIKFYQEMQEKQKQQESITRLPVFQTPPDHIDETFATKYRDFLGI
jgi:hypothetical protein